jgi:SNF2 family DNA or RNA helicase
VLYQFNHDKERLLKALGEDTPVIGGGTSDKLAAETVRAWNRGEVPVLIAHPASMGHGLNMQVGGHHVCWYSLTWDYELYDQANRRLYRRGQKETVFVHRLLARKTVDEAIVRAVNAKGRGQDALLAALKDLHRQRRS